VSRSVGAPYGKTKKDGSEQTSSIDSFERPVLQLGSYSASPQAIRGRLVCWPSSEPIRETAEGQLSTARVERRKRFLAAAGAGSCLAPYVSAEAHPLRYSHRSSNVFVMVSSELTRATSTNILPMPPIALSASGEALILGVHRVMRSAVTTSSVWSAGAASCRSAKTRRPELLLVSRPSLTRKPFEVTLSLHA